MISMNIRKIDSVVSLTFHIRIQILLIIFTIGICVHFIHVVILQIFVYFSVFFAIALLAGFLFFRRRLSTLMIKKV